MKNGVAIAMKQASRWQSVDRLLFEMRLASRRYTSFKKVGARLISDRGDQICDYAIMSVEM
jgi:hypothetical protein